MNLIWHKRLFNQSRFIKPHKIYILPTLSGIKLFCIIFLLLFVGLIYANNFVLFFDFLLFGLFICSMFYTHFNLDQVEILSINFKEHFCGEHSHFSVMVKNSGQLAKTSISFGLPESPLWEMAEKDKRSMSFDLASHEVKEIKIPVKLLKRGVADLKRVTMKTVYPFNFFRSFTYFSSPCQLVVYPARDHRVQINDIPQKHSLSQQSEEDIGLIKHENGRPLARIFWKRFALTGELYSRFHDQDRDYTVSLNWDDIKEVDLEQKLIILTSMLTTLENRSIPWELRIFDQTFYSRHLALKNVLNNLAAMS